MTAASSREFKLQDDIQLLPGVGPRKAEFLRALGVVRIIDLLEYFPFRYQRQEARTIENLDEGITATVVGQVTAIRGVYGRRGRTVSATLTDNTGRCSLYWFRGDWVMNKLEAGMNIEATGPVREYRRLPQIVNPRFTILGEDAQPVDESSAAKFEPVYPASADISSREIAKLIQRHLDRLIEHVEEWWDETYLKQRDLRERKWSIRTLHQPAQGEQDSQPARRRMAYDELLLMQLATGLSRRHRRESATAHALRSSAEIDRRIRDRFPFKLTSAQDRAIHEIVADLAGDRPMNRLLQGDVGCGKTVMALYAALVAIANKTQAAIMAPTELLADQHFRSTSKYLEGSRVHCGLLTGRLKDQERSDLLRQIDSGEMNLVVGTHALIQKDVSFARLGLVVIDEQHRFGVRQRAYMQRKGPAPHYLVMTATPIPRTLAMTVFGDLDVTTIDQLPPGRSRVETKIVVPDKHADAWGEVRSHLSRGEQAFVVYPLIDESDKIAARAATTESHRLREQIFPDFRVGLLHGRMKADERDAVMAEFAAGSLQVLVATSIVEVGIDVPNATCMVIEHPERYGLSQLHQLRGRIGRGKLAGHCFLMLAGGDGNENERLNVFASTTDGFKIAEEDLRLRGPGEVLGTRQHGLPELRVADLLRDGDILRLAQRDAQDLLRDDAFLRDARYRIPRERLMEKYSTSLDWIGVG